MVFILWEFSLNKVYLVRACLTKNQEPNTKWQWQKNKKIGLCTVASGVTWTSGVTVSRCSCNFFPRCHSQAGFPHESYPSGLAIPTEKNFLPNSSSKP